MSFKFLSKEWFDEVKSLRNDAMATLGDSSVPADVVLEALKTKLNISVPHPEGEKQFSIKDGDANLGHAADADTTVTVDYDVARRLFLEGDVSVAMQAFMAGQIKVEGDMAKLLTLQQYMTQYMGSASPVQVALREKVIAFTVA